MTDIAYLFQCGDTDLFALTRDETGAVLPIDLCAKGDWRRAESVRFHGSLPPWGIDVAWHDQEAAIQAGLSKNGFFISEREGLPERFWRKDEA